LSLASDLLLAGELVALPTETVYGLAADATNPQAIKKIYQAKGRPSDNPLIVHIPHYSMVEQFALIPNHLDISHFASTFWPGPLTILLPKKNHSLDSACAGLQKVALRVPDSQFFCQVMLHSGLALAAPSANLSGSLSPTSAKHVLSDMDGKIPLIVNGGECRVGLESTVIDVSSQTARILRPGGIGLDKLKEYFGDIVCAFEVSKNHAPESPGQKYRHYAPSLPLKICSSEHMVLSLDTVYLLTEETQKRLQFPKDQVILMGTLNNLNSVASSLFASLRLADSMKFKQIVCESLPTEGIGLAVMNRLLRASKG